MTKNQVVRPGGDTFSEAVNIDCILIPSPSLLKIGTFEDLCDWLLEVLLVLVIVEVEPKRTMAATEEPVQDRHELVCALKQCGVFINQE